VTFEEFWEVDRNTSRDYGYDDSKAAWQAGVADTKKRCAEIVETTQFTGNEMHFANEAIKAIKKME